jgi:hypothetical protein
MNAEPLGMVVPLLLERRMWIAGVVAVPPPPPEMLTVAIPAPPGVTETPAPTKSKTPASTVTGVPSSRTSTISPALVVGDSVGFG